MSNPKNAIQEIKNLMVKFGFMSNDNQLQSFKTSDDIIFQTEKLEAGKSINKINEAFEVSAVEDGTYRLKDNFEIQVEGGLITNVREIFVDAKLEDGTAIRIEGDVQLAAEVNWLIDHVRWDAEEDLSRIIGDAPAHMVAQNAKKLIDALRNFVISKMPADSTTKASA